MRFLLDTNVLSEVVRPTPDPGVVARLTAAEGDAALSSVTWHELRYGIERLAPGRRRDALEAFLRALPARYPVLPYDQRAADWHARERARLDRAGIQRPFADGQIAATAATHDLLLVTRNVKDFTHFDGVTTQSWWSEPR